MFDRFTDRARKVMGLAKAEAQQLNHEYIGTEHVLLGFLREGSGVGVNALKNMKIDLKRIRAGVEEIVKHGPMMVTQGNLPFTPRAKRVLELAVEEASNLGHNYIGTEHLLLGLIKENEGIAARVLLNLGVKLEEARMRIVEFLAVDQTYRAGREGASAAVRRPPEIAAAAMATLLHAARREVRGLPAVEPRRDVVDHLRHRLDAALREAAQMRAQLAAVKRERDDDAAILGPAVAATDVDGGPPLTRRARLLVHRAADAALQCDHPAAGSEHLVMALLDREGSLLERALTTLQFDVDAAMSLLVRWAGARESGGATASTSSTALTPELERLVQRARHLALANGRRRTAVGHLLLALIDDPADPAAVALAKAGIDLAEVRATVEKSLDDDGVLDQFEALSEGLSSASVHAGGLRYEIDQLADELRALGATIERLRLQVEG